jgi:hypothetical protein
MGCGSNLTGYCWDASKNQLWQYLMALACQVKSASVLVVFF